MKRERIVRNLIRTIFMAIVIVACCPAFGRTANASTIAELQDQIKKHQEEIKKANQKADQLKDKQSLIEEMIDDLNAEIINTMTCISLKEDEIQEKEEEILGKELELDGKRAAIEQKEREYYYAKEQLEQ